MFILNKLDMWFSGISWKISNPLKLPQNRRDIDKWSHVFELKIETKIEVCDPRNVLSLLTTTSVVTRKACKIIVFIRPSSLRHK